MTTGTNRSTSRTSETRVAANPRGNRSRRRRAANTGWTATARITAHTNRGMMGRSSARLSHTTPAISAMRIARSMVKRESSALPFSVSIIVASPLRCAFIPAARRDYALALARRGLLGRRDHADRIAVRQAVRRAVDDAVGGRKAGGNLHHLAQVARDGDGPQRDLAVGVHGGHAHSLLVEDQRAGRDAERLQVDGKLDARVGEGAGHQLARVVVDHDLHARRAALGIDRARRGIDDAAVDLAGIL